MAGCRSCSGCSPEPSSQITRKAEKLEKGERSENPRYPHVFVGKQAIYSDETAQIIVTVFPITLFRSTQDDVLYNDVAPANNQTKLVPFLERIIH